MSSAGFGARNTEIFGDWLGLPADELASLAADEVIWCFLADWMPRADTPIRSRAAIGFPGGHQGAIVLPNYGPTRRVRRIRHAGAFGNGDA